MTAFDRTSRASPDPASHIVPAFEYLNTSSRPAAAAVRQLVEDMLSRYPVEHRDQLVARFRLSNDVAHLGAFFELFLHELLIRSGCTIIAVEPPIEGSNHSQDFLVQAPCGTRFYLEAATASGRSSASSAEEKRLNAAIEAIDCVESPDFLLGVRYYGRPTQPLSLRRLRQSLARWLSGLSEIEKGQASLWEYSESGLLFEIEPFRRSQPGTGLGARSIGTLAPEGGWVKVHNSIKRAIEKKANEYSSLDVPFVVAINTLEFSSYDNFIDALFGTEVVRSFRINGHNYYEDGRQPNGLWHSLRGASNTRVSAVIGVSRMCPWSFARCQGLFVSNPWARQPIQLSALEIDRTTVNDSTLLISKGRSIFEIFALSSTWPEDAESNERG